MGDDPAQGPIDRMVTRLARGAREAISAGLIWSPSRDAWAKGAPGAADVVAAKWREARAAHTLAARYPPDTVSLLAEVEALGAVVGHAVVADVLHLHSTAELRRAARAYDRGAGDALDSQQAETLAWLRAVVHELAKGNQPIDRWFLFTNTHLRAGSPLQHVCPAEWLRAGRHAADPDDYYEVLLDAAKAINR